MIVNCEKCAARYKLDDSKVTGRGARITCPKCRHVFVVFPTDGVPDLEAAPPSTPAPPAASAAVPSAAVPAASAPKPRSTRSAESLDFRKVGIASWKVRVRIGLVYDFSDIKTLRKYIQDGRVTSDDVISHNGQAWVTIGDIPDLDAYFVQVYETAEANATPPPTEKVGASFEEEDSPTMIVGMGSLGNDLAADALRQVSQEGARTSGPPTPAGDGPFVDPFAALKSKQRDRVQARRGPAAPPPSAQAQSGSRKLGPVVVLLLLLGGAGAWWFTQRPPEPVAPTPATTGPAQPTQPEATPPSGDGGALREQINRTLQEAEPEPIAPETPELVPVGPRDPVRPTGSGGQGGSTNPSGVTTPTSPVDHASNCTSLAGQADWQQAAMACKMAAGATPTGAVLTSYGLALYHTGDRRGAEQQLRAAKDRGGGAVVFKYLGHIARDNGDPAGANGYYQQYLASNPADRADIEKEIRQLGGS